MPTTCSYGLVTRRGSPKTPHSNSPVPAGDYEHQIDEVNLKAALVRELGYVNDNAADRDVKSVAAVTRIWKGRRPLFLQEAPALLVTTNSALVRVARLFFGDVISTAEAKHRMVLVRASPIRRLRRFSGLSSRRRRQTCRESALLRIVWQPCSRQPICGRSMKLHWKD